jgi:hypothetical protein
VNSGYIPAKGEPGPAEILEALREAVADNPKLEEMPAVEVARQLVLEGRLQGEPSPVLVAGCWTPLKPRKAPSRPRSRPKRATPREDEDNAYLRLGEVLLRVGREEEAHAAYETGIRQAEKFGHTGMAEDLRLALAEVRRGPQTG